MIFVLKKVVILQCKNKTKDNGNETAYNNRL